MKLELEIDDSSHCYSAGQMLKGHALLLSTTGAEIKGITLKCVGRVSNKWFVQRGKHRKRRYERLFYFTSVQQHSVSSVPIGPTKVPFAFQLPDGTPSSFNGRYGHVVYFVEAVVERSWKSNIHARQYFSFNAIIDLNTIPGSTTPIEVYQEKTSFTFFCGRGLISAKLNFPRSGFVGGQPLNFVLEVKNMSARNIPTVTLTLVQRSLFRVKHHEKRAKANVLDIRFPAVGPGEEQIFTGSEHTIPPLPPTGLGFCSIIDVNYYFELVLDLFAEVPIYAKAPVLIGNIPLRELFIDLLPGAAVSGSGVATATATAPSIQELNDQPEAAPAYFSDALYPDLPPPSYQEAIASGGSEKPPHNHIQNGAAASASAPTEADLDGDDEDPYFTPRYAMYSWRTSSN